MDTEIAFIGLEFNYTINKVWLTDHKDEKYCKIFAQSCAKLITKTNDEKYRKIFAQSCAKLMIPSGFFKFEIILILSSGILGFFRTNVIGDMEKNDQSVYVIPVSK